MKELVLDLVGKLLFEFLAFNLLALLHFDRADADAAQGLLVRSRLR
jgi:hypothetical protein